MYKISILGEEDFQKHFTSLALSLLWMQEYVQDSLEPLSFTIEQEITKMETILDSLVVSLPKETIEKDLNAIAPDMVIVGSRITEDGYELVLEGPKDQFDELTIFWTDPYYGQLLEPCRYMTVQ